MFKSGPPRYSPCRQQLQSDDESGTPMCRSPLQGQIFASLHVSQGRAAELGRKGGRQKRHIYIHYEVDAPLTASARAWTPPVPGALPRKHVNELGYELVGLRSEDEWAPHRERILPLFSISEDGIWLIPPPAFRRWSPLQSEWDDAAPVRDKRVQ